ncbi:PE-PPE domain-containing protein [Mycobacterium sp. M1]|uniref:PE-PPE domain-containing protein n=1 Tax=Mycolicibacter acidiphilus TaxID=2835306 RepID=A0ABS5RHC3_9MYCO|nr:PE-PPE domain-containing protein [Mycolicibacter acidiphilus]MBS9533675.1 PE-PPE domain-containing protein [Mycolicibacter acidiphilus]
MIVGASSISTPGQGYADAAVNLFLQGFTGNTQIISTPEGLYPFLGPFGETFDLSVAQGATTLVDAINDRINSTDLPAVSPENPVVVFGYSQGADVETSAMQALAHQAVPVPSGDVHFVMIGDPANPDGGLLERMNLPGDPMMTISSLGLTFSGATPDDLYPTDIYTNEYDLFADFPKYPIDFLSDLNAVMGILEHGTYLGLTPDQVSDAIQLPTTGGMTDYFMMPAQTLPLLAPLQLIPFIGNPLVDLLQPDLSVLVNLGYGNTLDGTYEDTAAGTVLGGWDGGDANVGTPLGFLPDTSVLEQIPQALFGGLEKGVTDAFNDLITPSNYVYALPSWADEVIKAGEAIIPGTTFSILSPVPTTLNDLFGTFPPHTGVPPLDVATALLLTLPQLDYHEFTYELANGNLLDAIGIPIAADLGILPLALVGAVL